jgi:hypothetical protein
MRTQILCPACNKAYLEYRKAGQNKYVSDHCWYCEDAQHISFYPADLRLVLKAGGIDIDSVNYPKRLHITAEGVTAG